MLSPSVSEILEKVVEYGTVALPVVSYGWALWSWRTADYSALRPWRRATMVLAVVLTGVGLCLAAFSIIEIYRHPEVSAALPEASIVSMEVGALVALVALGVSLFAKSWPRIALVLSALCLLWLFFLIALSP